MQKANFSIKINASKEKVWKILWDIETYNKWTTVFSEGSTMVSDWKVGGKTLFLDGKGNGMVSTIAEINTNVFISFKHLGMLNNGVEDFESDSIKQWAGALENYSLKSVDENTELSIEMDIDENYKEFFLKTFPVALNKVKELSESDN